MPNQRRYDMMGYVYNDQYSSNRRMITSKPNSRLLSASQRPTSWESVGVNSYYITEEDDNFHKISLKLYGTAKYWWMLADFNDQLSLTSLPANTKVVVPDLTYEGD